MPAIKPLVDHEQALALLREQFDAPISHLDIMEGGEIAQTFSFAADGLEYILRFNYHMGANFEKEAFLYSAIASPRIPIPPIVRVGRLGGLHYAISHRIAGTPLTQLPPAAYSALMPQFIETLEAIHAVDTSATSGYGVFGDDGVGFFPSWRASLTAIRDEDPEWDFYGHWHGLFASTFLDRDVFDAIYDRMAHLLDNCPEEHTLIHGNYGFGNVLACDGRITAVLDWIDAKYGDFVYDIAWVDFWWPGMGFPDRVRQSYAQKDLEIPHYTERLLCYRCYIALDALRFYAKAGREDSYRWARDRILSFLG